VDALDALHKRVSSPRLSGDVDPKALENILRAGLRAPDHAQLRPWRFLTVSGDGAIVCKGVTIGENSVIGAGSIVTGDIPKNSIAAGNPARVVKALDPDRQLVTRQTLFDDPQALADEMNKVDRWILGQNSTAGWARSVIFPRRGD